MGTREEKGKKSTLDLIYTNEIDLLTEIGVHKSCMSDHHTIEIATSYKPKIEKRSSEKIHRNVNILRGLHFYSEDINWKEVNKRIREIPWEEVKENKSMVELNEYLIIQIIQICIELIPKKRHKKRCFKKNTKSRKKTIRKNENVKERQEKSN